MQFSNTKVLDSAYQSTMYLSTSPRCCLSPQGTDLVCSCWKVSTPLKLAAFVPRRFFKIILLSHSCVQLILPHCKCLSLKLGLQTSVMQRKIWQGDSKLPPLWKGTACFGANSKEGTFARICLESCTWLLLDPLQTLVPPHDVSSNRPKNILQQMHRSIKWEIV